MTDEPPCLLELRGIRKSFGGVHALRGVNFDLRAGEIHALLGENGAGKSTLIRTLGGIHSPDAGSILVEGRSVEIASPAVAASLGIGIIHQELALAPNMSVAENLFLGREPSRFGWLNRLAMQKQAIALIRTMGFEELGDVTAPVETLPVALRQLVEIARALFTAARILVLDEPTSSLTALETELLFRKLQSLRRQGIGMVYISHRLEEIRRLASRITVLRDGKSIGTQDAAHLEESTLIKWMVGREVAHHVDRPARRWGQVVLRASHLRNAHVRDVSFDLHAGEVLGIAGLVGAGRSELARALFGIDGLEAGEISFGNQPLVHHSPARSIAAGMVLIPEDRKLEGLIMNNTVAFNAALPWVEQWIHWGWPNGRKREAIVRRALETFSVRSANSEIGMATLSGGNQQKVLVGRWLEKQPRVLVLDEPTRGVDVGARADLFRVVAHLVEVGVAVVLISSELNEVLYFAHRVAIYRDGRIIRLAQAEDLSLESLMAELTGASI